MTSEQILASRKRVRSRAPLRLGLAGGGTDVAPYCDVFGGVVLNATIDRYCYATLEECIGETVEFVAPDLGLTDRLEMDCDVCPSAPLLLHRAIYQRMTQEFDLGRPSVRLTTVSDAPPGSGLGSSSTLVVSVVEAFREYFSLPLSEYDIARLAFEIERLDFGQAGGSQDQYAAAFGGFNIMEFGENGRVIVNPLRIKEATQRELEASILLFHTGISRESAKIIDRQTHHIATGSTAQIEATHELKEEAIAMKESLLRGDLGQLATVLNRGWNAKKKLAEGITNSHIEECFTVARGAGALAGKVSGAGGGGYILFLTDPVRRPAVARALEQLNVGSVQPVHFVSEGAVAWSLR
ncbi:GHMP family kinase ATP-binding protein [Mycolicibacterium arenosum]|uniref:D-alpha-D-heptose-7-phosphate kinase n=1 Tax=Mycolicibacterium arenosum TaxID=2952157 RepID=A0ABT1M827_9MYCO|nr:D-alpha-D-heptose-7-phosphate kinase [Mycolicibacterium sp. CAU 1645]MCP9275278.1 D-alpha-D-heptose-7-phosphate kinase [Mycolicibacterium sp. CAU 1645]